MPRRPSSLLPAFSLCALALVAASVALPVLAQGSSATCESIRSRIEADIRTKGITDFRVSVADAGAKEPGRRVGDCEGGRKVILYARGVAAESPRTAPATPAARPGARTSEPILTECADGTVQMGGTCKRR